MTNTLDTAFAAVAGVLADIDDPAARFEGLREAEAKWGETLKRIRQGIALDLYAQGKPWREVGEIMGGVTAQRAWQISRGE